MNGHMESESEDEVFVGPITIKEIKKALTLRRKTLVLDKCEEGQTIDEKDQKLELKNLTFTPQPQKLHREIDDPHMRRSMSLAIHPMTFNCATNDDTVEMDTSGITSNSETDSIELDDDSLNATGTEDSLEIETPAPPPSPELNRYNGSPYPTPCRTRRRHYSSLKEIAEEEGNTPKRYEINTPKHCAENTPKNYEENSPMQYEGNTPKHYEENTPKHYEENSPMQYEGNTPKHYEENTSKQYEGNMPMQYEGKTPKHYEENTPKQYEGNTPKRYKINTPKHCEENTPKHYEENSPMQYEGNTPKHYEENTPKQYEGNTPKRYEVITPKRSAFFPEIANVVHLGEWRDTHESFNVSEESSRLSYDSISILSKMDDNLLAETSKLSLDPSVSCKSTKMNLSDICENNDDQCTEEKLKNRELLIEKMKQYEAMSQQLKNSKKCPAQMSESSTDDVIILNSEENEFSLDEDGPILNTTQSKKLEMFIEETDETLNSESPMKVVAVEIGDEDKRFSRLTSEREVEAKTDVSTSNQSVFLCDLERRYGKERFDEALATLGSQIRLQISSEIESDTNVTLPDDTENHYSLTNGELSPVRSSSPEFEIDSPSKQSTTAEPGSGIPYTFVSADYSLISEAEVPVESAGDENAKAVGAFTADKDGGFLSVLSEAALYHASLKHSENYMGVPPSNINVEVTEDSVVQIDDSVPHDSEQDDEICNENLDKSNSILYLSNTCTKNSFITNEDYIKKEDAGLQRSYDVKIEQSTKCAADIDDRMNFGHSLHDTDVSLHTSCSREMDATDDLNESDRRNLERTTSTEFSSDDDEKNSFHDTLEEMEMLMKYGMDYIMSSHDVDFKNSPSKEDKNSVFNSVSTPKNPTEDFKKFEDFGDGIREPDHGTEDCEAFTEQADECGPSTSEIAENVEDRISELGSQFTDAYIEKDLHEVAFPKSQFTPSREVTSNKCQEVISSAVNQIHFKKPSPFKLPIRPVSIAHTQKPVIHAVKKSPLVSPCKKTANYDKIMSPVGAYIHNTPSPSLVTNVKPRLHHTTPRKLQIGRSPATPANASFKTVKSHSKTPSGMQVVDDKGMENVDINNICPVLPVVDYNSVPLLKLEKSQTEKMPRVNERMKKLVDTPRPQPRVIRHEGRVKVMPMKSSPLKKYAGNSDDSYMADNDADGEISVVVGKHASRTNTLGF